MDAVSTPNLESIARCLIATNNLRPKSADALDSPEIVTVAVDLAEKTFANSGLVRPPGISNSAWSDLQVKTAAENRKKL